MTVSEYLPHCKTCGPLAAPCALEDAIRACEVHHAVKPAHKTSWVKLPTALPRKGE